MPRVTNIYKLDRREIEEKFVLANVLGDTETAATIDHFCEIFVIPLDQDRIRSRMADLNNLKDAIRKMDAKLVKEVKGK